MELSTSNLVSINDLSKEDINLIFENASYFKKQLKSPIKKSNELKNKTIANMFFENSTRTRISFELAEKRLGADIINFTAINSSIIKGESLIDTVKNIEAMQIDSIVIRHSSAGIPYYLTKFCKANIINAGDGTHEHPTQALLDIFSINESFGRISGLRVCIIGDIMHSRVALSNIKGLQKLGAKVSVFGPSIMLPYKLNQLGVKIYDNIDKAIEENDVVNVLRIQLERGAGKYFPSVDEYSKYFCITQELINKNNKDIFILHPGPVNKEIELTSTVCEGKNQIILNQVTNGVAVRMAVLSLLNN